MEMGKTSHVIWADLEWTLRGSRGPGTSVVVTGHGSTCVDLTIQEKMFVCLSKVGSH